MKKLLLLSLTLFTLGANAQTIFLENFNDISGSTAGGAGTYSFPAGWFLRNVDNRTPDPSVAYVNEAWERREDFANDVTDSCAFSTSYYSPTGAADDWMWTPAIGPLPAGCELRWNGLTYDPSYPDGYEVRIMTSGPPTGGNGVLGNQVSNSTLLLSVPAENTTWTPHNVSLAAYAGQTVYIGFRNNSNDKFLLLIDDVEVLQLLNYDAVMNDVPAWSEYTIIPGNQQPSLDLSANIRNNGVSDITNVVMTADVYDINGTLVHNSSSAAHPLLASGDDITLSATNPFTPSATNIYEAYYSVSITEADGNTTNDTLLGNTIYIEDSTYARDNGNLNGALGIGAGVTGYLGNQYEVTHVSRLSSVSYFLNGQVAGSTVGMAVFEMSAGVPTNQIYLATPLNLTADTTGLITFMLDSTLILNPGTYLFTAVEYDSTLTVGTTASIFTPGTCWVDWAGNPFGTWTNVESFGPAYENTFVVRAGLLDVCYGFNVTASATDNEICIGDTVTLTAVSTGNGFTWDNGSIGATIDVTPVSDSTFIVTATDTYGCADTAMVNIIVNPLPNVVIYSASLTANECENTIDTLWVTGGSSYLWNDGTSNNYNIVTHAAGTTSWSVTGTDVNGCINTGNISITSVLPLPTVTATASDDTVCVGNTVTLNGGGASTYTWTNGVINGTPFTPAVTATYTVTGTDTSGCSNTAAVSVVVDACIGIQEPALNGFINVYPNPGAGLFIVQVQQHGNLVITDMTGRIVFSRLVQVGRTDVDMTGFAAGRYTLSFTNEAGEYHTGLVKQ